MTEWVDISQVHFMPATPASQNLRRTYFKTKEYAEFYQAIATAQGFVARVYPVAGGHMVAWAPDWEDFWPQ